MISFLIIDGWLVPHLPTLARLTCFFFLFGVLLLQFFGSFLQLCKIWSILIISWSKSASSLPAATAPRGR